MDKRLRVVVRGTGVGVPAAVVTNDFFTSYLDTSDEWIVTRSGIRERRRVGPGESTVTMAKQAGLGAIADAGLTPADIDLLLLATVTPDTFVPPGSAWLQAELGMVDTPAVDVNAACAGLVYAFVQAAMYIESGLYRNVLVVGADSLTRITDYEDRATCVLFGDGAGAAVVSAADNGQRGIIYHRLGMNGRGAELIQVPAGGSRLPASPTTVAERLHYIRMNGREVYKFAVTKFHELVEEALTATGYRAEDLALIIPHQSNLRIIDSVRSRLDLPADKIAVNIDRYGNTSSASIGLTLHEMRKTGRVKEGDLVMFIAFGAGLTWAVVLWRM